jgi:hypothetical protein
MQGANSRWFTLPGRLSTDEQVFDRRSAVKLYLIFAAEHGVVNPDTSYCEMGCNELLVPKPCYTAPGAMLCRNLYRTEQSYMAWVQRLNSNTAPGR